MKCSGCQCDLSSDETHKCCAMCRAKMRVRAAFYRANPGKPFGRSIGRPLTAEERRAAATEYCRRWQVKNPEKVQAQREQRRLHPYKPSPQVSRKHRLKKRGVSVEQYATLFDQQQGKCRICGVAASGRRALAVDHDHQTGAVRGLLCTRCNMGLGYFKDDPVRLQVAVNYLQQILTTLP